MNKYLIPILSIASIITLFQLSKTNDTYPVDYTGRIELQTTQNEVLLTTQSQAKLQFADKNGQPLFYSSYDAKKKKTIKIQYAMAYPPDFDVNTYDKPIVVLGHDGYDKAQKPNWDPAMKGDLNYLVKNLYRLASPIAQNGSIVIIPAYRGENQSQGTIDVAGGDVMDTIAAIRFVKTQLPKDKEYDVNLVGTSRGALTAVMTATVYPVNKVVIGYGVMDLPNWNKNEANCGTSKDCLAKREVVYVKYTSWDQILDSDGIKTAKARNNSKLPKFTRVGINIDHFANSKTKFYLGQGLNDKHVKPYNSFKFLSTLNKLSMPNAIDLFYGTHSNKSEGTHGLYTRLTSNYVNDTQGRGATIDDLKAKFVIEASTFVTSTNLVQSPITQLQQQLGQETLAKYEKK